MLLGAFIVYTDYTGNQLSRGDIIDHLIGICLDSAAIGVGLAAAATAIFPGVMLSSAALGVLIGAIAPIAGFFVTALIINPIVDKVSECFTSPEVEQIAPSKVNACSNALMK